MLRLRKELASVGASRSVELEDCEAELEEVQKKYRKLQ